MKWFVWWVIGFAVLVAVGLIITLLYSLSLLGPLFNLLIISPVALMIGCGIEDWWKRRQYFKRKDS